MWYFDIVYDLFEVISSQKIFSILFGVRGSYVKGPVPGGRRAMTQSRPRMDPKTL
jgi:hypothetical protein